MVLTNMLPSQGNGTYRFHMWARDREGQTLLARHTHDDVHQRERNEAIRSDRYTGTGRNREWSELRQLRMGADAVAQDDSDRRLDDLRAGRRRRRSGPPTYNNPRADIQALFPGLNNTNGAVGFRILDTTSLTNGTHTIVWVVSDDQGSVEGIGSRFFTVSNGTSALTTAALLAEDSQPAGGSARDSGDGSPRVEPDSRRPRCFEPDATGGSWC